MRSVVRLARTTNGISVYLGGSMNGHRHFVDHDECGDGERTSMTVDEQTRIAALNAAIAYVAGTNMANVEMYANAFADYIITGTMPKPPAGVTW